MVFPLYLDDDPDQCQAAADGLAEHNAGRPVILLGRDLQSKLKEFISPINCLDMREASYSLHDLASKAFFRIMDAPTDFRTSRPQTKRTGDSNRCPDAHLKRKFLHDAVILTSADFGKLNAVR